MSEELKSILSIMKFISEQESAKVEVKEYGCKLILEYISKLENELLLETEKFNDYLKEQLNYKIIVNNALEYIKENTYETKEGVLLPRTPMSISVLLNILGRGNE